MIDLRNEYNVDAPRAKGMYLENAPQEIWGSPDWCLEPKYDGQRVTLQIGKCKSILLGRNRVDFLKGVSKAGPYRRQDEVNPRLTAMVDDELAGTVLDGELTEVYKQDGTYDKMTMERLRTGQYVGYVVWGVLFFKGVDVRNQSEWSRRVMAEYAVQKLTEKFKWAGGRLKVTPRMEATLENLKKLFEAGYEGGVVKKVNAPIPAGSRTNPNWWKVKGAQFRTVDAFVIGVSQAKNGGSGLTGVKPMLNGKAATFHVGMSRDGELVEVGKMSNLPEDAVDYGWKEFERFRFRVVEMMVSGWDGTAFRFPRFVKWRDDKAPSDCRFGEQIGGQDE